MADGVEIKIDDKIAGSIAQKLAQIKTAAKEADSEVDKLKATLAQVSANSAFRKDAMEAEKLKNTLRQASNITVSYYGQVSKLNTALDHQGRAFANGAKQANSYAKSLNNAKSGTTSLNGSVNQLVATLGAYVGARAFIDTANAAQQLNNQLRTITTSQAEFNSLQQQLFDLANRTRSGVEETAQLYVNFYKVLDSVGIKQGELLRMVETLNKGYQIGGKSAQEAAGATRQFIQALQSGVLRGQELNSVMEQMPIEILNALAKAAGTSIEKLRKLAEEGKLTRDVLREALGSAAGQIDELFARTTPTINNAFTILRNNAIRFFTENTQAGQLLASIIMLIADNLNIVIPLIVAFGVAWGVVQLAKLAADLYNLAKAAAAFSISIAPAVATMLIWAGIIATVVTALTLLGYTIAKLVGQGDAFEQWIADSIRAVQNFGSEIMKQVEGAGTGAVAALNTKLEQTQSAFNPGVTSAATQATSAVQTFATAATTGAQKASKAIQSVEQAISGLANRMDYSTKQATKLFNQLARMGGSSGSFQTAGITNTGANSSFAGSYATGGSFTVGGRAGRDKNPVHFNATKGERVTIQTRAQQRRNGGGSGYVDARVINFNVITSDADSFRRSKRQVADDFGEIINQ